MSITKHIAERLNNTQYPFRPFDDLVKLAKENDIVIVAGASDDLVELYGAIRNEIDAYEGTTVYLNKDGLFEYCECECKYSNAAKAGCKTIKAIFGKDDISWQYETDIPHETFEVFDDCDVYCVGIVFSLGDL